ncbi:unnamed protein product [Cylicostephanus goldi]|uniref:Peptidase A2 domain-containing protein n=1 Tax=Cylicostephanus goldi TaxID=71465 RepID=A0A3P6RBF7_CYLGO|nr:unnamed protein product [Cylicostephanus goldi]
MLKHRFPRAAKTSVGLVTSNQLAAQLLAVEDNVEVAVRALFHHALSALCDRTNLLALAIHASLANDPTFTIRNLLGRQDVAATHLGNDLVQIHRCLAIPPSHYAISPFNGTCFSKPIVQISLNSGTSLQAFIDPFTRVISYETPVVQCSSVPQFFFVHDSQYSEFDPFSGHFRSLPDVQTITTPPHLNTSFLALPLTIFHNLVLTNLSELTQDYQLHELWTAVNQERLLHLDKSLASNPAYTSYTEEPSHFSITALLFGSWSLFDVWIATCSFVVSFGILKTLLLVYCNVAYPGWQPRLRNILKAASIPTNQVSLPYAPTRIGNSGSEQRNPPSALEQVELAHVAIDAKSVWPPRATLAPINVLVFDNMQRFFIAQIPIKVNDVSILALVDTGAAITVTSRATAPLLGVFNFNKSDVPSAVGMAGIPIKLLGVAHLRFQIGSFTFHHPVYFTESSCVPQSVESYNIIMGNDLLSRLPPWSIDYSSKTFSLADQQVSILCSSLSSSQSTVNDGPIPVRVAETTVLPPQVETFVPCESTAPCDQLVLTSQADPLTAKSLMVSPAVINTGKAQVLVANPNSSFITLYKGQQISLASAMHNQNGYQYDTQCS